MIKFFLFELPMAMFTLSIAMACGMIYFVIKIFEFIFKIFFPNKKSFKNFRSPKDLEFVSDGIEFERYCADLLSRNGFYNVQVTQASNDYGVDVIAERQNTKFAIQCKFYSSTVGVSAVQEVNSGKTFHNCDVGVVMTNSTFTKNAIELADKTGVLLWDIYQLDKFVKNATY